VCRLARRNTVFNICGTRIIECPDIDKPLIAVLMMHVWYNALSNMDVVVAIS
jgi:hypothetical protein